MKTQKAGWLLLGIGLFLVTSGLMIGTAVTYALTKTGGTVGMEKVAAEVKPAWKGGETLNIRMIEKFREEFGQDCVTYTVDTGALQQTKDWSGKKFNLAVAGADGAYSMFHGFEFLDGGFFPAKNPGAENTVVISETLAWILFRTTRAVDMELEAYDQTFRIAGVFKNPENILHTLVQPGLPDIYLPAETMLELDEKAFISSVELAADDSIIFGGNTERINSALRRMGADTARFTVTDFASKTKSIAQKPALIMIATGFITILLCVVHIFKTISGLIRQLWKAQREYSLNPQRSEWLKQVLGLIVPAAVIAALVLLWHYSKLKLYIPVEFIPGETLDGQKYQELIRESLRRIFSGIREEASLNVRLFQAAGLLSGISFRSAFYVGSLLTCTGMAALNHTPLTAKLVKTGIWQAVALLAACGLCLKFGLPVHIQTEGILVLWTFVAVCLTAKHAKNKMNHERSVVLV